MADIEHSAIDDPNIHEPKGASTASQYDVYESNGAGSGNWKRPVRMGVYDYDDAATASSAIALTSANTDYELTNDGAGSNTNLTYALPEAANIWNTSTNRFDFSDLSLGDTIDIRLDIEVTTSNANTAVTVNLEMGVGGTTFSIPFITVTNFKTAGTYRMTRFNSIYLGSANAKDNPARFLIQADNTGATVEVIGWYCRVLRMQE